MSIRLLGAEPSIRTKLLVSYFIFLIPLVAFGLLWTANRADEERHVVVVATEEDAEHVSFHLTSVIETLEATAKTVSGIPAVREMKDDASPILSSMLALNPLVNNLAIANRDGLRVATADASPQLVASFADLDFFREVMRTGESVVGEPRIAGGGRTEGRYVIPIASPLRDAAGTQIGVIVMGLAVDDLARAVALRKEDDGSFSFAVDGQGKVLAHPNRELVRSRRALAGIPPVDALLRGEQGTVEFVDPSDGLAYFAAYQPVSSTPWGVVSVYPLSRLEASKRATTVGGLSSIALSAALALLLATIVGRPIAHSLGQLATAAQAIGEGKLGMTVGVKRRDEIGMLAEAFNTMSRDLVEVIDRLDRTGRQLEKAYREVGEALTSGPDLDRICEVAMSSSAERLGMGAAAVGLLDLTGTRLTWVAASGSPPGVTVDASVDIGEADSLIPNAIASLAPAIRDRKGVAGEPGTPPGAALAMPLVSQGQCLGAFVLYDGESHSVLSPDEIATAQSFANQVAVAVTNSFAHAEIERLVGELKASHEQVAAQNQELQAQNEEIRAQSEELQAQHEEIRAAIAALQERNEELLGLQAKTRASLDRLLAVGHVSRAVSSSLDLEEVCQQAIESTVTVMGARVGLFHLVNWQSQALELRAAVGAPPEYLQDYARLPIDDQTISGKAVITKQTQILTEASPRPPMTWQTMAVLGVGTLVTIPVICKGNVVGVLNVSGPHDRPASQEEVDLLETIANQIGITVDNSHLYTQLREIDSLKDEFISIASHELRSPLTSIKGYAQLLLRRALRHDAQEPDLRGLQVINEQIDRMTRLVNELLDVSRIESGRLDLQRQPVDLNRLLAKVVENAQITSDSHKLHVELPEVTATGYCDEWRIEEVMQNLLGNAIKYSPGGGAIWVKAAVAAGEATISVSDVGMGIPPDSLAHVFERFYQASNVDRRNYGGLGLGLFVSRQIVHLHGGRMWVESEMGKGSTFYFTLPLV